MCGDKQVDKVPWQFTHSVAFVRQLIKPLFTRIQSETGNYPEQLLEVTDNNPRRDECVSPQEEEIDQCIGGE